jgi:hypothetical protein
MYVSLRKNHDSYVVAQRWLEGEERGDGAPFRFRRVEGFRQL